MADLSSQFKEQKPHLAKFFHEAEELENELESLKEFSDIQKLDFPYELKEVIDQGGMKKIYCALDLTTNREVALAVISKDEISQKDLRYFINEIRITATLQHPNIMPIYDAGLDPQGNPYFTMKLLNGENLAKILKELNKGNKPYLKTFKTDHLLEIFKSICHAVAFAHSKAIAHLDLKPENILINDFGEVLVLDWGIAKLLNRHHFPEDEKFLDNLNGIEQTLFGAVKGTPGYMAPEQKKPNESVDQLADIYGLGAILYSLLTFERPTDPIGKLPDKPLFSVIERATHLDPKLRYQSAQQLIDEINKYQSGHATLAEDAGFYRLITLLINRNKRLFFTAFAFLLTMITLTSFFVNELRLSEKDAKENEKQALELLDKWQKEKAEREKQEKNSAQHYLTVGKQEFHRLNYDKAQEYIEKALSLSPNHKDIHMALAECLFVKQKYNEILARFPEGLSHRKFYSVTKKLAALKSDNEKLNNEQNIELIKDLIELDRHVYTSFMTAVFININSSKSYPERRNNLEKIFHLLNPSAKITYDPQNDRIKIFGQPVFSYTPIAGLNLKQLDLSKTHFSESLMLRSLENLEYLDLKGTGVIHISGVYELPKINYLDIEKTPIRSFLKRNYLMQVDYLNLAHTTLSHYKADTWQVKTLNICHTNNLDWGTIVNGKFKPKVVVVNTSLFQKNINFAKRLKSWGIEIKVLKDNEAFDFNSSSMKP